MAFKYAFLLMTSVWLVSGQRPSFAGSKPIGYPEIEKPADALGNRFGDDTPLPIEARGDRDLIERISKMPVDQQPFWYLNWKALEENRKNPQSYDLRPNSFTDQGVLSANQNLPSSDLGSRFGSNNQNANNPNTQTNNQNVNVPNSNNEQTKRQNYKNSNSRYNRRSY